MSNEEIINYFRESGEPNFQIFLDNYIQWDIIEEETCGFCPTSCGQEFCPVITMRSK